MSEINGGTKLSLQEIGDPKGALTAKGNENTGSKILLDNGVPRILALVSVVDDGNHKRPDDAEEGEDDEVVDDEEGIELGHDVSLTSRLGLVSCPDRQPAEDDGEGQIDTRCNGR